MKRAKIILLIMLVTIFLTGCTVVRIDTNNIDNIVDVVLSKNNNLYNRVGKGYKYYIPRGVTYLDTNDLNEKLYSSGVYYYLYIDIVSYFFDIDNDYIEDDNLYYSKIIDKDTKGYIEITEKKDLYYIVFWYNSSKIEAITTKDKINEVILNASYILSTIKFNDNVIELSLNETYFSNQEEQYIKFQNKGTVDYFLVYNEESNN